MVSQLVKEKVRLIENRSDYQRVGSKGHKPSAPSHRWSSAMAFEIQEI